MTDATWYPAAGTTTGGIDGYVYNNADTDWDTIREAATGAGASATAGAASSLVGRADAITGGAYADPNDWIFYRGFNTIDMRTTPGAGAVFSAINWEVSSSGGYDECEGTGHGSNDDTYGYTAPCDMSGLTSEDAIVPADYDHCTLSPSSSEIYGPKLDNSAPAGVGESNDFSWDFDSDGLSAADAAVGGYFGFTIREGHDIEDGEFRHPGGSGSKYSGFGQRNTDMGGTQYDPEMDVTYTIVTSDIQAFNGITLSNIETFNGVTAANGETINGVDF